MPPTLARPRNDPRQYDDLVADWWDPAGVFAMLHWLAAARAELIPPPTRDDAVLVDIACGGGLLAPHVAPTPYRHVGVDIGVEATRTAAAHGVDAVRADARQLPLAAASADVVVAGEVLEHVPDTPRVVAEICRVLRPGGTVVIDTIADTRLAALIVVSIGERIPGAAPPGLHDPALFVDRHALVTAFAEHGVTLSLRGLRPPALGYLRWAVARRRIKAGRQTTPLPAVRLLPTRLTSVLFQGHGTKAG